MEDCPHDGWPPDTAEAAQRFLRRNRGRTLHSVRHAPERASLDNARHRRIDRRSRLDSAVEGSTMGAGGEHCLGVGIDDSGGRDCRMALHDGNPWAAWEVAPESAKSLEPDASWQNARVRSVSDCRLSVCGEWTSAGTPFGAK